MPPLASVTECFVFIVAGKGSRSYEAKGLPQTCFDPGQISLGERSFDEIPIGRLGRPRDQALAVLYLVSDDADFVTGFDLRVDGGSLATWGARTKFDAQSQKR